MADNVNITVQDTINDIVVNAAVIVEEIDINVQAAVDVVDIVANPNNYVVNINRIIGEQVQSDWTQNDNQAPDYIKNKPTIPAAQVNSDWNAISGVAEILNKPTIPAAVTKTSDLTNDGEDGVNPFITLADVPVPTNGLPTGGTAGQILTKIDSTDYNATWQENYADWTSVVKHIVKNNGVTTLSKGKAVYITTSNGTNMLVGYASNNTEATSSKTIGLLQSDLTTTGANSTGFVVTEGLLGGLNTQGATAGDPIWLGTNGDLIYGLANKPYAPAHLVFIGIVTKVSAGNGEIFVKVQNGFELNEIHDVDLKTNVPVNGDILGFDGTLWVNKTIAAWLGFTPFQLPSLTSGSVLFSNGTTISEDNSNLFWDDTNNRLGIGTSTPNSKINALDGTVAELKFNSGASNNTPSLACGNRAANGKFAALVTGTAGAGFLYDSLGYFEIGTDTKTSYTNNGLGSGTAVSRMRIFTNGNIGINTTTDAGYKLDVNGTARVSGTTTITPASLTGSAATSALDISQTWNTTGNPNAINLNVTNTASGGASNLMRLQLNGVSQFLVSRFGTIIANGFSILAENNSIQRLSTATTPNLLLTQNANLNRTSGTVNALDINVGIAPTSGTLIHNHLTIQGTINQTGGANGITRGLYINPTLTAAADWRAIEVASGGAYINTTSVDASAILQADSTTKGFLPPRMTTTQKNAISTPAAGLVVYDTTLGKLCVRTASSWETITSI